MRSIRIAAAAGLLVALTMQPVVADAAADKSKNVSVVAEIKYWGGSHLAFEGDYAYAAQWNGRGERPKVGGVHIMDISDTPREVGFFKCPGDDVDVAP